MVTSDFSQGVYQGVYALWLEVPLGGNDHHVFELFKTLLGVLAKGGRISRDESEANLEEFTF